MTCNEALNGIEKGASEGVEVNADLNEDLNLELETAIKKGGNESLLVEKVGFESQNAKVGTKEDAMTDTAKENSEVIPVEASEDSDQFIIKQLH